MNVCENRNVFSLDLKVDKVKQSSTVLGIKHFPLLGLGFRVLGRLFRVGLPLGLSGFVSMFAIRIGSLSKCTKLVLG